MDWENTIECKMETPHNSSKTKNDQGAVNNGTESNFAELGGDATLQNIANGVEGRVIGVTYEVYLRLAFKTCNKCERKKRKPTKNARSQNFAAHGYE